jgi:thioredoxin reductase (NADPH)
VTNALDCAVIGGGPAGILAAVYLARFRRTVLLAQSGRPRASWIPRTRNVPGYPDGIGGTDLLERLTEQLDRYEVRRVDARIQGLSGARGHFELSDAARPVVRARRVILASGVADNIPGDLSKLWSLVEAGRVRLCPVCDAYELRGKRIGVLSRGDHAVGEALFLAAYTRSVSLFTHGSGGLSDAATAELARARIDVRSAAVTDVTDGGALNVTLNDGETVGLEALYVGFGVRVHSELATALGARCDDHGYLFVDQKQQTTIPGLYAAGDVVQSLSQISVAFGQAAMAASAINVALNEEGVRVRG